MHERISLALLSAVLLLPAFLWAQGGSGWRNGGGRTARGSFERNLPPTGNRFPSHARGGNFSRASGGGRAAHFRDGLGFSQHHPWRQDSAGYGFAPYFPYVYPGGYAEYGSPYSYYGCPYTYAPYFPSLYFYDLAYQEAIRTREEADRYEAAFAEERARAEGTSAVAPGGYDPGRTEAAIAALRVRLTLDGLELQPSPSGLSLEIGSGRHTLRISASASAAD
jgi:hypothetical protein